MPHARPLESLHCRERGDADGGIGELHADAVRVVAASSRQTEERTLSARRGRSTMKHHQPRDAKTFNKRIGGALAVLALAVAGASFHTLIQSAQAQDGAA